MTAHEPSPPGREPGADLVPCPDPACGLPAEIVSRWAWPGPDGALEHVRTRCVIGHVYTPLASYIAHLCAESTVNPTHRA